MELILQKSVTLSEAYDEKNMKEKPDWKAARKTMYISLAVFAGSIGVSALGDWLNVWMISETVRLTDIIAYAVGVSFLLAIPKAFIEQKEIATKQTAQNKENFMYYVLAPAFKNSDIEGFSDLPAHYIGWRLLEKGESSTWSRISRDSELGNVYKVVLDGDQIHITWSRETSELTLTK